MPYLHVRVVEGTGLPWSAPQVRTSFEKVGIFATEFEWFVKRKDLKESHDPIWDSSNSFSLSRDDIQSGRITFEVRSKSDKVSLGFATLKLKYFEENSEFRGWLPVRFRGKPLAAFSERSGGVAVRTAVTQRDVFAAATPPLELMPDSDIPIVEADARVESVVIDTGVDILTKLKSESDSKTEDSDALSAFERRFSAKPAEEHIAELASRGRADGKCDHLSTTTTTVGDKFSMETSTSVRAVFPETVGPKPDETGPEYMLRLTSVGAVDSVSIGLVDRRHSPASKLRVGDKKTTTATTTVEDSSHLRDDVLKSMEYTVSQRKFKSEIAGLKSEYELQQEEQRRFVEQRKQQRREQQMAHMTSALTVADKSVLYEVDDELQTADGIGAAPKRPLKSSSDDFVRFETAEETVRSETRNPYGTYKPACGIPAAATVPLPTRDTTGSSPSIADMSRSMTMPKSKKTSTVGAALGKATTTFGGVMTALEDMTEMGDTSMESYMAALSAHTGTSHRIEDSGRIYVVIKCETVEMFGSSLSGEELESKRTDALKLTPAAARPFPLRLWCGTYNCGNSQLGGLFHWLPLGSSVDGGGIDMYVLSLQECKPTAEERPPELPDEATMTEDEQREFLRQESKVQFRVLREIMAQLGDEHICVASRNMWQIRLFVIVRKSLRDSVSGLSISNVATGLGGVGKNKGCVAISLDFEGASLCFVGSHLAAHQTQAERRRLDYRKICRELSLGHHKEQLLAKFHYVFWMGDLNYRVDWAVHSLPDGGWSEPVSKAERVLGSDDSKKGKKKKKRLSFSLSKHSRRKPQRLVQAAVAAKTVVPEDVFESDLSADSSSDEKVPEPVAFCGSGQRQKHGSFEDKKRSDAWRPPMLHSRQASRSDGALLGETDRQKLAKKFRTESKILVSKSACASFVKDSPTAVVFEDFTRTLAKTDTGDYEQVFMGFDQLRKAMKARRAFVGFHEGCVTFEPTFKVVRGEFIRYQMQRLPAWCDRVLFRCISAAAHSAAGSRHGGEFDPTAAVSELGGGCLDGVRVEKYRCYDRAEAPKSDHKPVSCLMEVKVWNRKPSIDDDFGEALIALTECSARNLLAGDINGYSDPFVLFPPQPLLRKQVSSARINNTLDPIWQNDHFPKLHLLRNCVGYLQTALLILHVYDHDRFSTNDLIGVGAIPVGRLVQSLCFPTQLSIELTLDGKPAGVFKCTATLIINSKEVAIGPSKKGGFLSKMFGGKSADGGKAKKDTGTAAASAGTKPKKKTFMKLKKKKKDSKAKAKKDTGAVL